LEAGYFYYNNLDMTNLLVSTDNIAERERLEEEFSVVNSYFRVPVSEKGTLEAIFRSI
jgi:hypothetical protein